MISHIARIEPEFGAVDAIAASTRPVSVLHLCSPSHMPEQHTRVARNLSYNIRELAGDLAPTMPISLPAHIYLASMTALYKLAILPTACISHTQGPTTSPTAPGKCCIVCVHMNECYFFHVIL
jgi:hypothetical protein